MSYSTILAQVKTVLSGVSGTANVYDYWRYSSDMTTLKSLFVSNGILHTWMITRTSASAEASLDSQVFRNHQFELTGFYQVDDSAESEKTFQALCDTIMNTFDQTSNFTLNATADQIQAAQLLEFTHVEFCGVLCHQARILITANEEVTQ